MRTFFLIFVFLCIISKISAYKLQQLPDHNFNNAYAYYNGSQFICSFRFHYLISEVTFLSLSTRYPLGEISSSLVSNSSGAFLYEFYGTTFGTGQSTATIDWVIDAALVNSDLITNCEAPPDNLDIEVLNNAAMILPENEGSFSRPFFIIKVKNFKKTTPPVLKVNSTELSFENLISITPNIYVYYRGFNSSIYDASQVSFSLYGRTTYFTHTLKTAIPKGGFNNGELKSIEYFPMNTGALEGTTDSKFLHMLATVEFEKNQTSVAVLRDTLSEYQLKMAEGNLTHSVYQASIITIPTFSLSLSLFNESGMQRTTKNFVSNYVSPIIDSEVFVNSEYVDQLVIFSIGKTNNTNIVFVDIKLSNRSYSVPLTYPYGYVSRSSNLFTKTLQVYLPYPNTAEIHYLAKSSSATLPPPIDNSAPELISLKVITIPGSFYHLVTATIIDDISGFYSFERFGTNANLVQGTILSGTYEFILDLQSLSLLSTFQLCDVASNCRDIMVSDYINTNLDIIPRKYLNLTDIVDIKFELNNIDVSENGVYNRLLIRTGTIDKDFHPHIYFFSDLTKLILGLAYDTKASIGSYDEKLGYYAVPFYIPKNSVTKIFNYYFFNTNQQVIKNSFLQSMFPDSQLRIRSSYGDEIGPIIDSIKKNSSETTDSTAGYVGWTITIIDRVNGFQSGKISFVSELDLIQYNFTFDLSDKILGDQYSSNYFFKIPLHLNCRSQAFYLYWVELIDNCGATSIYLKDSPDLVYAVDTNPLMYFMNPTQGSLIMSSCPPSKIEDTPPTISLSFQPKAIDATSRSNRTVTFSLTAIDDSGINNHSIPRLYLQDSNFNFYVQDFVYESNDETNIVYYCSVTVPYGFGLGSGLSISVFGVIDNQANIVGYGPYALRLTGNFITVESKPSTELILVSSTDINPKGPSMVLVGKNFKQGDLLSILYPNGAISDYDTSFVSTTTLSASPPIPRDVEYVLVFIKRADNSKSNEIVVNVIHDGPLDDRSDSSSDSNSDSSSSIDSSQESSSSDDPHTSNPPQKCLNDCSGGSHGQCTTQGCRCISPWVGLDCSSKIVVITHPPNVNTSIPETTIIVPKENQDQQDEPVFFAIISVVAVNELDNNNNILSEYPLTRWVSENKLSRFAKYTDKSYYYSASITNKRDQSLTNISVSIDYFDIEQPVNITFANQVLTMNPYSLKYSVNISQYSFSSSLNTLQVVLSASLESQNDKSECSSIQTGDTVESESEFIKMQVNDHSLYGRFIKRGIVDGRTRQISNTPLDSIYKSKSTSASKSESFIGINIPHYQKLVQIDPDFSVLVDNRAVSKNDENSICTSKSSSSLTAGQIAGIVVGGVVFLFIIAAFIVYRLSKNGTSTLAVKLRKIV
ncbi:hypothetical protein CYY_000351 [Polysphondylium violaceum]|uniref:EGF-like domain-containing protein n=1 Tax=Polysphondylium violaceum TaxID=133409 RepID=A0A8J4Q400_9MYCE|nr:hypothetical protein CYY_000351 [Polysphondylium violaceum]